jgi:hypothetical protein
MSLEKPATQESTRPKIIEQTAKKAWVAFLAIALLGCAQKIPFLDGHVNVNVDKSLSAHKEPVIAGYEEAIRVFERHLPPDADTPSLTVRVEIVPNGSSYCGIHRHIASPEKTAISPNCAYAESADFGISTDIAIQDISYHESFHQLVQLCQLISYSDKEIVFNHQLTGMEEKLVSVQGPRIKIMRSDGSIRFLTHWKREQYS